MIKKYIFVLILGVFAISFNFSHSMTANAETSITQTNKTTTTTKDDQQKVSADTNKAKFVQDTLPQTGVEANHSGLYFTIAGFFLLLAVFTSRSKSTRNLNVSEKQKK